MVHARTGGEKVGDDGLWAADDKDTERKCRVLRKAEEDVDDFELSFLMHPLSVLPHLWIIMLLDFNLLNAINDNDARPAPFIGLTPDSLEGTDEELFSLFLEVLVKHVCGALYRDD